MFDARLDRRQLLGGAGLASAGLAAPGWALSPMPPPLPFPLAASTTAVGALFDGYVAADRLPGAVASLGTGLEPPTFISRGKQGREPGATPMSPDSIFRIYSMSKPITGIAAMLLIEDGKLKLDQDIGDFLPGFKKPMVAIDPEKSLDARPAKGPVTVRGLMTHTSGLGYIINTKGALRQAYAEAGLTGAFVSRNPIPGLPPVTPARDLAAFGEGISRLPLVNDPGTRWRYSAGLDVLGRVIELASGMEFEAFLRRRLFEPLGMTSSWFQVPKSELGRMTTNYGILGANTLPLDPGASSVYADPTTLKLGGGGLAMSPRDYDRFLAMLAGRGALGRTRVMKEATAMLAMSNLLPPGTDTANTFVTGQGFGAGGRVTIARDPLGGAGIGTFGWAGAAGTVAWVDAARGIRAAGYPQFMPDGAVPFTREFGRAVYGAA